MKWAAFLLLFVQAWNALGLIPRLSATRNECAHVPAGLFCWYAQRFDLYHVNPPLPRMLATAALLPKTDVCLEFINRVPKESPRRVEFDTAHFFADTNALNYHSIICRARLAGVAWLAAGGILLWQLATAIFGPRAGLMALALWVFEPTVNAHGALATPDVPAAVAGVAAVLALWQFARTGSMRDAAACGVGLGVALMTKFTHLISLPVGLALYITACFDGRCAIHKLTMRAHVYRLVVMVTSCWCVVWAGYGFSGFGATLESVALRSKMFRGSQGIGQWLESSWLGKCPTPLPPDYIRGIDRQQCDFEGGQQSYLRGEWRSRGWWYFYLYALAIKLPVGLLALVSLALFASIARVRDSCRFESALVWLPAVSLITVASAKSGFTQHFRYILPAVPFLILGASQLAERLPRSPRLTACLAWVLTATSVASAAWNYPNWLGYFNEPAGGPLDGWRHLADSNVDWGQDLIALRQWLDHHTDARPIRMAYKNYYDYVIYTREQFGQPAPGESAYVVIDAASLTESRYAWLRALVPTARVGTSILIYENP